MIATAITVNPVWNESAPMSNATLTAVPPANSPTAKSTARRIQQREAYNQRKKDGLCVGCGEPTDVVDALYCGGCQEKRKERREAANGS